MQSVAALTLLALLAGCGDDVATQDLGAPDHGVPDLMVADLSFDLSVDAALPDLASDAGQCPASCADVDPDDCTNDVCVAGSCRNVPRATCGDRAACGSCAGADSDGDGLPDVVEQRGWIDSNCNGQDDGPAIDLRLPMADPARRNIYLAYGYLEKAGAGNTCSSDADCTVKGEQCLAQVCTHSHRPKPEAIAAVVKAFADRGVILVVDDAPARIPEVDVVSFGTDSNPAVRTLDAACVGPSAANFYDLKDTYLDPRRRLVYHFAVFSHLAECTVRNGASCASCPADASGFKPAFGITGTAELPGNDFIVSLGYLAFDLGAGWSLAAEAGTLMHELGHNLGLQHGGGAADPNFKLNYFSVMNGNFQLVGIRSAGAGVRVDYSGAVLDTLDENALSEPAGINEGGRDPGHSDDQVYFTDGLGNSQLATATGPVNWSGNTDGTGAPIIDTGTVGPFDLNGDGVIGTMTGWNDWANLQPAFQCIPSGLAGGYVPGAKMMREVPAGASRSSMRMVPSANRR